MAGIGSNANIAKVRLAEQADNPAAPSATFSILYLLASGVLRVRNAAATVYEYVTTAHTHAGTTNGPKLDQANTHETPDTDSATGSLHHTIGAGATQAAAGDHTHAAPDASVVTYTPTTATDWDTDADPGDVDNALDQLAERVDDLEAAGGGSGHVIQDEGTPLTARANLNFVGAGVAATDDAGNDATVVTISSGGSASAPVTAGGLVYAYNSFR